MRKYLSVFVTMALLLIVAACGNAGNENGTGDGTDKPTLTISETPFENVWFVNSIVKQVAEELGYPVQFTESEIGVAYLGLSTGEIDIYTDVWAPTLQATYIEKYEDSIELVGTLYEEAPLGWAVPTYMGIDSINDIKGREAEFGGRVVGYDPSSGHMMTSEKVIEGYDLDLELLSGSSLSMLAEVKRATTNEEPIIFLGWRPHSMFQMFDIQLLEDPKGFFSVDSVLFGVAKDFNEKAPDVYQFLENFTMELDDVETALLRMEEEGLDADQLATDWIEANRDQIDQWLGK